MRKDGIQKTRRGTDFTHEAEFIYNNRKEGRQDAGRVVNKTREIIKFLFSVKQKPDKSAEKEEEGRYFGGSGNQIMVRESGRANGPGKSSRTIEC